MSKIRQDIIEAYYTNQDKENIEKKIKALIKIMPAGNDKYKVAKILAEKLYGVEDYDNSLLYYREAVKSNPQCRRSFSAMASCEMLRGNPDKMLPLINTATKLLLNDYKEYLKNIKKDKGTIKKDVKIFYSLRGYCNFMLKNYQQAIYDYNIALNKGGEAETHKDSEIYFNLAMANIEMYAVEETIKNLKKCLELNPEHPFAAEYLQREEGAKKINDEVRKFSNAAGKKASKNTILEKQI